MSRGNRAAPRGAPAPPQMPPEFAPRGTVDLHPCRLCGRNFSQETLPRHEAICTKAAKKTRKVFNSLKQRIAGTELTLAQAQKSVAKPIPRPKANWRSQHNQFIQAVRAAKMASIAEKTGQPIPAAALAAFNTPTQHDDYIQCPHCGRRFAEKAADRHIAFCATKSTRISGPGATAAKATAASRQQTRLGYKAPAPAPRAAPPAMGGGGGSGGGGRGAQPPGRIPLAHTSASGGMIRDDYDSADYSSNASGYSASLARKMASGAATGSKPLGSTMSRGTPPAARSSLANGSSNAGRSSGYGSQAGRPPPPGAGSASRRPAPGGNGAARAPPSGASKLGATSKQSGAKFCHECGTPYPNSDLKFCTECGAKRMNIT